MKFEEHINLKGKHAFLSPSQPHWLNYDEDKLYQKYTGAYAQSLGTSLHELGETLIRNRLKLKKSDKLTVISHLLHDGIPREVIDIDRLYNNFMNYVNDAIGFRLTPEQILYYSSYCFGTADAISFRKVDNVDFLRIHDYKSGVLPAKMEQLLVYAALFCLEYKIKPAEIGCELRIYQNDEIVFHNPTAEEIQETMNIIIRESNFLEKLNEEV